MRSCLVNCFAYGRLWDSIPMLEHEIEDRAPPRAAKRKALPQDGSENTPRGSLIRRVFWHKAD